MSIVYTTNLEPGVYEVNRVKNGDKGSYSCILTTSKKMFDVPKKIYGEYIETVDHIFSYYKLSGHTMGCLFHGEPGAGKSLTSELLCNMAIKHNMPVIYIQGMNNNDSGASSALIELFKNFKNVVVYIDEFGKIFNMQAQMMFLSILTDASSNNLWVLTENDESMITKFISKRAGRIRYNIEFNKISERAVLEYCADMKVSEKFKENLLEKYDSTDMFTFDMLKALVSEELFNISRYGHSKPIDEICTMLNVKDVLTTYTLKPREVKYLGIVLDEERRMNVLCELTSKILRKHYEKTIPITARDYPKLISAPGTMRLDLTVRSEGWKLFTEQDLRNNLKSLNEMMESNMATKSFTERVTGTTIKEEIDGLPRSLISFKGTYFEVILGVYNKDGTEVFLG